MADVKNDASTDIESLTKKFAADMTSACADLRKARLAKGKGKADPKQDAKKDAKKDAKQPAEPPVVTFSLSGNADSKSRTPAEQAAQVVAGRSWVCWGAHMSDKARHVLMKADGKVSWDAKKALGEDFDAFKKKWADAMKANSLKNAQGKDGWYDGDAFHVEIADSKITKTDERACACLEEYARLSRKENKGKNEKFEKDYAKLLAPYLKPYETAAPKR